MTENEAINELYDIQNQFERSVLGAECNDEYAKEALRDNKRAVKSIKMAVSALKEIQKYRAIGTVEVLKKAEGCITLVKRNKTLERMIDECMEYEKIGTVEECREAVEKQKPKVPDYEGDGYADGHMVYDTWICPGCGECYEADYDDYDYCPNCGQAIQWNKNLEGNI